MNPTNYIEIDSTYRDRIKNPSPGEFEVQFARAAQTKPLAMADAVSLQANIVPGETTAPWNLHVLNEFADTVGFVPTAAANSLVKNIGQLDTTQLSRQRETVVATVLLFDPSSDNRSFYVKQYVPTAQPATPNRPQVCWLLQQVGAYNGCIIAQYNPYSALPAPADQLAVLNNKARILSYEYIGHGVAKIILDGPLQIPVNGFSTVPFFIQNMTRPGITDTAAAPNTIIPSQSGEIFVQFGSDADQAYTNKYLVNESTGQYRKIISYDGDAHLVTLDLSGQPAVAGAAAVGLQETVLSRRRSGPINRWEIGDNLSIRIDPPGDNALLGLTSTRHSTNTGPATQVILYRGGAGYTAGATVRTTIAHGRSGGLGLTVTIDSIYAGPPNPSGCVLGVTLVAGGDDYRPGDCVSIDDGAATNLAFLIVTQVDTNLNNPASAADAAELYPLNPSRTTFFVGEEASGLLGSGTPSLKIGDFIEPFFGSQMYREVIRDGVPPLAAGSLAYKNLALTQIGNVTDNTACHAIDTGPAPDNDALTFYDCMVNVGTRVTGVFTVTGLGGNPDITVPLMPTTRVVGVIYNDNPPAVFSGIIFISPQFSDGQNGVYPAGVLLPTGLVTNVEFHGGLARPFAVNFQANAATPRASLVMFPTGEQALYNDAYVGMKLCLTAPAADSTGDAGDAIISDPIIGNPTTEIEGVITSYDYVTRTITVDPPLDVGTNNFTAMIIPPRESRQILRYAHFNGLLTESVARGSRTIVFPRVRSGPAFVGTASAESGYYNGLYIVLRPTQTTGMPGEIRTIISYDGPSRTATLDRPLNLQYTVFDATFSAAPEPCEGDYVVGSNEFEVYFQPGPRNPPYYVVSDADVGRLALSYQDSAGNGGTFPAGSYISQITSGAPGTNFTCTIVQPDGTPAILNLGVGGANAELQLGVMPSPYFYINSGVVSRAFTAPLPLNLLQPSLNSASDPTSNQLAVMIGTNYDNEMPLLYSGSMVSQQEMVCYEITLINLVLPNAPVVGGNGGRIAFYPYVYVQLENVTSPSGGNSINIYSNNPHSRRMLFRAAIDDVNNPGSTPFIKINSDGQTMTVKFKPNDNLKFSVHLPDGTIFNTVLSENPSPEPANPYAQLSAMFAIRRVN